MRKVINKSNKKLFFPTIELSIAPNEIKTVSEEIFEKVKYNAWIEEVVYGRYNKGQKKINNIT